VTVRSYLAKETEGSLWDLWLTTERWLILGGDLVFGSPQ
jgi:hypothetical protein